MSLQDLIAQKKQIDQQIEQVFEEEKAEAISDVLSKVKEYGLTAAECGVVAVQKATVTPIKTRKKVAAKFRGPQGQEWSGRGRQPTWMQACIRDGFSLDDLRVKKEAA
jgi:DNA-binding protein H-NS